MTITEGQNDRFIISINFRDTDISFWRNGASVWQSHLSQGGVDAVITLMNHLRFAHNLLVGRYTAELVILKAGSAIPLEPPITTIARGLNIMSDEPGHLEISSEQIRDVLDSWLHSLSHHLSAIFHTPDAIIDDVLYPPRIPSELKSVLGIHPIVLTGDFGLLRGLDQFLQDALNMPVVAEITHK